MAYRRLWSPVALQLVAMDTDTPDLPAHWSTVSFDVSGPDLDAAFVRDDRSAYVVLDRSQLNETAPDFLTECYQFVADAEAGVGAFVTSKVALARAVPEAVQFAREFIHRYEDGVELIRCLGSDIWREYRQFYATDAPVPDTVDPDTLITLLDEEHADDGGVDGSSIADDAELERFDPSVEETPNLVLDIDVFPRHQDDTLPAEDTEFPYQTPDQELFDHRFPHIETDDGSDDPPMGAER